MLHQKVIIVGAGAAGIAAASRLLSKNVTNFNILEAQNRIGGRIFTTDFGDAAIDLGAQWVHGEEGNVAHVLGTAAGLLKDDSYDLRTSRYVFSDGEFIDDKSASKLFALGREILYDEESLTKFDGSLGEYFISKERLKHSDLKVDESTIDSYIEWAQRFQNSIDGSDSWFQTSARGTLEYHECEGNTLTRWKIGGYSNVLELLMGSNAAKIKDKILLNKVVKTIKWDSCPVEVLCTDGQKFSADHVILTVSLGVLRENMYSLFVPSLPYNKLKAIQTLGFGTAAKIFVKFPYRWWPADCNGFSLLWKKNSSPSKFVGQLKWAEEVFGFYSVDSNPLLLCGWVVGQAARDMEQSTDAQVLEACHQLLVTFVGQHFNIPPPDAVLRSRWQSDAFVRGAYSFRTVESDKAGASAADLAAPLCQLSGTPSVLFAGEATHDHFYSTVHGAIETGWREADRVISLNDRFIKYEEVDNKIHSVIIVGAGMAGLGAAKRLVEAGIEDFLILEGQSRAGGRVWSVPVDSGEQNYIELGAQWIHGEDNPVYRLAAKRGLISNILSDEGQGLYVKPNGEEIPLKLVQEVARVVGDILETCCKFVNETDTPESIGDFLARKFSDYLDSCNDLPEVRRDKMDLFDWHIRFQVIDNSCDQLTCLSARAWGMYQYTGGADYNNLTRGYSSLITCLTDGLPPGALQTNTSVRSICYHQLPAKVLCEDGRLVQANHVIVTSSLGYLKERHKTMFDPPLPPDIIKAIDCLGFDTINKLFLVYDKPWWSEDLQGIQLIWDHKNCSDCEKQIWLRSVSGFDVLANLRGVLLGWVGGEGAVDMEKLSTEQISQDCTEVLRNFMNSPDIPPPDKIFRSSWQSNQFVQGGYSHTTTKCDRENVGPETLAHPVYPPNCDKHPVILLAGEATHESYFSTTHGAYLSGERQAQVAVDYIKHNLSS